MEISVQKTTEQVELLNGRVIETQRYVLAWSIHGLAGDWKKDQNKLIMCFRDGIFHECLGWSFPTKFYGTRQYWALNSAIDRALRHIERELATVNATEKSSQVQSAN